jgi:hypothetical protein
MMIFKKAISRRTVLRGMGVTLSLPLLDAMVPAFASAQSGAVRPVKRLSFQYVPDGIIMDQWTPAAEGAGFELSPILEPLAPFRDKFLVLTGLDSNQAASLPGEIAAEHARAGSAYLTGVHTLGRNMEAAVHAGTSVDQFAALELGKETELASLELGIESGEVASACGGGYSCAYYNTISWRNAATPLPMENNPRAVFERMFGDSSSTSREERLARMQANRSIVDFVVKEVPRLLGDIGPSDRAKVDQFLEALRDIERRIQKAE